MNLVYLRIFVIQPCFLFVHPCPLFSRGRIASGVYSHVVVVDLWSGDNVFRLQPTDAFKTRRPLLVGRDLFRQVKGWTLVAVNRHTLPWNEPLKSGASS